VKERVYKNYLLSLLLIILAFNFMDRLALGLVLQNIKVDLHLSDTQLGILGGIAFALFYSLLGIPIARWADRGNRATIISLTTFLWCAAVALCGVAGSFLQLLLIRIGVAVGEAGCIPPAHSLIADYFSRAERPRAVALYMQGSSLSVVIGYFLAGWLNEAYGWRITFMVLGLPGLALAALAWLTIKEPRVAGGAAKHADKSAAALEYGVSPARPEAIYPDVKEVCRTLWRNATFRHLVLCFAVMYFFAYGTLQWQPAFFIRSFGMGTGELGTWFTLIFGVGGAAGTYLGGEWAARRARNNELLQLRAMALVVVAFGFVSVLIYLTSNRYLAFSLLALSAVAGATVNGPLFATIQTLVPERMRAVAIAVLYLFANLIGMGLGPLVAGALSDSLRPWAGEESLRYALLILTPGYFWGGWHLWRASMTVSRDLEAVELVGAVVGEGTIE